MSWLQQIRNLVRSAISLPIKTFTVNYKVNYNVILIKILQEKLGSNYVKSFSIISLLGWEKGKKKKRLPRRSSEYMIY